MSLPGNIQPPVPARLVGWILALFTLLVYAPVFFHDFIYFDDPAYVLNNPMVQAGLTWPGLKWAFLGSHASNWHPLTWLSHMLDCQLVGLNAGAQHFINVIFHAANTCLLFHLWHRLTGKIWPSALVAALFAWHPLHVESVAWIAERKDVLSTFFALLATLAYVCHAQLPAIHARTWFSPALIWSLLFFALGLLAKPMLVTLPFVFLLLDAWPLGRLPPATFQLQKFSRLTAEKIPFLLLATVSCVLTFLAQHAGAAVATLQDRPAALRLENAVMAYADYVLKTAWPARLALPYPLPAAYPAYGLLLAGFLLVSISLAAWWWHRQSPWLWTGWLWFLGTLVPVIGLVQVGNQAMADRYLYWPAIGLFVAAAFAAADGVARHPTWRLPVTIATVMILGGSIAITETQLGYWQNTRTLFSHTLAVTRHNAQAELMLGIAYEHENDIPRALEHFDAALKLDPALTVWMPDGSHPLAGRAALLRAVSAENARQTGQAIANYNQALARDPSLVEAHNNLGNLLDEIGDLTAARQHYETALRLAPDNALAHENLGTLLLKLGQFDQALGQYQAATRQQPADAHVPYLVGKAYLRRGEPDEAVKWLHQALELDPNDPQALALLARLLATDEDSTRRDGTQAVALAEKANAVAGQGQPFFLDVLAMAYAEAGRGSAAEQTAAEALDLATKAGLTNLETTIRKHLDAYKAGHPFREAFTNTVATP
jgi:tetratricopeptide (TPR) repeat protein